MSQPNLELEIQRLEEQFAAHPGSLLFARLADLLRKCGELDRALAVVEEGLTQHTDYLSAHIVHARTLEDMGRDVQAGDAYRGVLDLDAQNLVALRALARMAETSGDREEAAEWYGRLLAVDPRNEEAESALGRLGEAAAAESEPEPEAESEPEPEAESEPDEDTVWEGGPTDAFGLASDAFGLESGPDGEWESIGSSGWPWREQEEDVPGPATSAARDEPASDQEEGPVTREEELLQPPETATTESTEALWPAWGGEAVEARSSWAETDEETYEAPEPAEELEPSEGPQPADALEPAEPGPAEDAGSEPVSVEGVEEPEPIEPSAAEAQPEPEAASEPEEASDADLPTETLATLYATQGLYREAVTIYEELVRRRPHDEALAERLRVAREELDGEDGEPPEAATGGGPVSAGGRSARETPVGERLARAERPVRDHLRALLRGEAEPDARPGEGPD